MKNYKSNRIAIILILFCMITIVFYERRPITNQEDKIEQVYNLLDENHKQIIIINKGEDATIDRFRIRSSDRQYTQVNKQYNGDIIFAISFPVTGGGILDNEMTVLTNLEITEIVGYKVRE